MKGFTSLEQSKKLAEILPLESADMSWYKETKMFPFELYTLPYSNSKHFVRIDGGDTLLPCWSLAALMDVLPSASLDSSDDHHYRLHFNKKFSEWHNNPIDACVEMIDMLHEQMFYDFNNS